MARYPIKLIFIFILIALILFIPLGKAFQNDKVFLEFFYLKNCESCEEAKPVVNTIESKYPNLTVRRYLIETLPVALIISDEYCTFISNENFTKENMGNIVEIYISKNDEKIIIENIYKEYFGEWQEKKQIVEQIQNNYTNFVLVQNCIADSVPIVIIRNQTYNSCVVYEINDITVEKIENTLEIFNLTTSNNSNNNDNETINNTANKTINNSDEDFLLPGFEIMIIIISLIILIFVRKKYKKK